MNFFSNLVFFPNEFTEVVNFENCYLGIYPEFFLIIVLSCLIGFLVVRFVRRTAMAGPPQ